jgi:hypothetical protein
MILRVFGRRRRNAPMEAQSEVLARMLDPRFESTRYRPLLTKRVK